MNIAALSPAVFEARYAGTRDPWSFANDAYELNRYRTIVAGLRRPTYGTVYEPGCSVGVLTQQLASIGSHVIATDFAPSAVAQARRRCADHPNVEIICADVRTFVPVPCLDLIIFSEIGYYFSAADLTQLCRQLSECLIPGGELVAAHWLGNSEDHVLHGDAVHEILGDALTLAAQRSERHPGFRLNSWRKP